MATAVVGFKGIHRDTNEGLCPDGECMQLIGATATEEGIKMLEVPKELYTAEGQYTHIKWFAKGNCYLAIDTSTNYLVKLVENTPSPGEPTTLTPGNVAEVTVTNYETVGNMICCFTADGIYYVLHKGDDFLELGNKPNPPRLHASNMAMKVEDIIERGVTPGDGTTRQYVSGLCLVCQSTLQASGHYIDRAFFRVGFRMFDGTYISVSPIYSCEPTESQNESVKRTGDDVHQLHTIYYIPGLDKKYDLFGINRGEGAELQNNPYLCSSLLKDAFNYNIGKVSNGENPNPTYDVWCGVCGFKPTLFVESDDLSNWKGLITSIDVFTTGSVIHHKMTEVRDSNGNVSQEIVYTPKEEYAKDVELALSTFRKVASFDLDGSLTWQLEDLSPDKLQVQDALSDFNTNSLIVSGQGEQTLVYNNRLHIGDLSEKLPSSYELSEYLNFLHIPRQKDSYEFIQYGGSDAYLAFRLHAYDYADFIDVLNGGRTSDQYLYRYKAWLSFGYGVNTDFDRRIVYTRHQVDRNGAELTYKNGGGWGAGMANAFVLDSVHGSGNVSRTVNADDGYVIVDDNNRSTYATQDAIRTERMFSTVETIGELEVETGISDVYGSHSNTPLIYSNPLLSYPHNNASKLAAYKKYEAGNILVVDGQFYYLVSEYPEIFLDGYYYRWRTASGSELFTELSTSTTIYVFPNVDERCKVFGVTLYKDSDTGKETPSTTSITQSTHDYTVKREYELKDIGIGSVSINYDDTQEEHYSLGEKGTFYYSLVDVEALGSNPILLRENVLKVSGLDNPMVFPSRQTYQMDGKIVGMQANVEELGEGQHGENPLYVFTDVGTWAMYVDKTGQTVYPYTDAVSGDVLTGDTVSLAESVAIVTERGLMLLRGKQRTLLSAALDGEDSWLLPSGVAVGQTEPLTGGDTMIRKVTEVSLIANEAKLRDGDRFRQYLQGARLGYDYVHGLLYVSNAAKAYTYVYNLASGEWSKMAVTVTDWVSAYPKCVFTVESQQVNESTSQQENEQTQETTTTYTTHFWTTDNMAKTDSKLLLISRPIKVARGLKKMDQFSLEGLIRQSTAALGTGDSRWEAYGSSITFEGETMSGAQKLGVYVLGSTDGLSYQMCGYKETGKPTSHIVGRFLRTNAYRYFIVAIVGGLKTNSILNGIVLDVSQAYNTRIR